MKGTIRAYMASLAAVIIGSASGAQDASRDPKAQAVLDAVVAAYRTMPSFQSKVNVKVSLSSPELMQEPQLVTLEVKAQRPNKVNLSYTEKSTDGKIVRHRIVSDGQTVYRWRGDLNSYSKTKAGATFPVLPSHISLPDIDIFLRGKDLKDLPIALTLGQPVKVGNVDMDVLDAKVSQPGLPINATVRLLFGQKDRLARSFIYEGKGKDPRSNKDVTFLIEAMYEQLPSNPVPTAADFNFVPPPGAKQEKAPVTPGRSQD